MQAAYSASKAGIVGMTLPIACEIARNSRYAPSRRVFFLAPMMGSLPQELQESPGKLSPFPLRLGRRDEYTALARSIVENTMIVGETIGLDGAVRLNAK